MKIAFNADDYTLVNNEEEFLQHYPKPLYGHYRPQPWTTPDKYPCLMKEIATMNNPCGADHAMLTFIYDFTEVKS